MVKWCDLDPQQIPVGKGREKKHQKQQTNKSAHTHIPQTYDKQKVYDLNLTDSQ